MLRIRERLCSHTYEKSLNYEVPRLMCNHDEGCCFRTSSYVCGVTREASSFKLELLDQVCGHGYDVSLECIFSRSFWMIIRLPILLCCTVDLAWRE